MESCVNRNVRDRAKVLGTTETCRQVGLRRTDAGLSTEDGGTRDRFVHELLLHVLLCRITENWKGISKLWTFYLAKLKELVLLATLIVARNWICGVSEKTWKW